MNVQGKQIVQGNINQISNRAAMGLPEYYTSPACEVVPKEIGAVSKLLRMGIDDRTIASSVDLEARVTLAFFNAALGNPRINVYDPPMVDVPAGEGLVGLPEDRVDSLFEKYRTYGVHRNWIEKECPRFVYRFEPFRIGKYPVTNLEYLEFLKQTKWESLPTAWPDGRMLPFQATVPVYTIKPEDADAYVTWLSARTGRNFRLPNEYEWEYAAAGPDGKDFPWGNTFKSDACNSLECKLQMASPVGLFPDGASWVGAEDMAGNVEEYVSGTYHPYPGGEIVEDDLYKLLGHYRIARGGAYNRFQDLTRCQRRHGPYPKSLYAMGFRLAEDII